MKILAIDSSTELCSVALWLDGEMLVREELAGQRHSELLLPMVHELLAEAGLDLKALDGIAFGEGPGSFTGLRIGCGVAQGLAFGADLPVAGVCTLLALAEASGAGRVIACLDARMNEVYAGLYRREGSGWRALAGPVVCPPSLAPLLGGAGCIGAGPGFAAYPALRERMQGRLARIVADAIPHARGIVKLAAPRFTAGEFGAPETAEPVYVRDQVALKISER